MLLAGSGLGLHARPDGRGFLLARLGAAACGQPAHDLYELHTAVRPLSTIRSANIAGTERNTGPARPSSQL